jgi:hypothetical protein
MSDDDDDDIKGEVIPFVGTTELLPQAPVDELEQDLEQAKENMREIAKIGMEAVAQTATWADQSQSDRMYTALSSLMKSTMEANRELIQTHKTKQEMEQAGFEGPSHVTNQLVVTTSELLDKLLEKKPK